VWRSRPRISGRAKKFTLRWPSPVVAWGLPVIDQPASGDSPKQAFAAFAELETFAD